VGAAAQPGHLRRAGTTGMGPEAGTEEVEAATTTVGTVGTTGEVGETAEMATAATARTRAAATDEGMIRRGCNHSLK